MSEISQRRVVIGDVHGHYECLMLLLAKIAPTSEDQVYFLGDLIDRGPKSAQVVEFVKENDKGKYVLFGGLPKDIDKKMLIWENHSEHQEDQRSLRYMLENQVVVSKRLPSVTQS
jgi:hypothetical protein